jgi:ABC-type glycerol-3-phosphate transport system substrate-binding protein
MKKGITILAVLLALVFAFAACTTSNGGNGDDGPGATPPPPVGNGDGPVGEIRWSTVPAEQERFLDHHFPATDLGGITLRVHGFGDPYSDDPFDGPRYQMFRDYTERKFNITLDWSNMHYAGAGAWGDVPDHIVNTVAAGDPSVHLFANANAGFWFFGMARQNALVSMDTWARATLPPSWFEGHSELWGQVWGFASGPLGSWNIWAYNRDLAHRIGIHSTPQQMFTSGQWNWDQFIDYMIEVRDLLPEGMVPMSNEAPGITLQNTMAFVNGGYVFNPSTGVPGVADAQYLEAIRFIQRLNQNAILGPHWFAEYQGIGGQSSFASGQWAFTRTSLGSGNTLLEHVVPWGLGGFDFEFGIVVPPWNPDRVTWPTSGNWRDLRSANPGYMRSYARDGSTNLLIAGTPAQVTPEVYFNIMMSFHRTRGRDTVYALEEFRTGIPAPARLDPLPDLFTDLDREIYRWWVADPKWDLLQVFQQSLSMPGTVVAGAYLLPGQWLNGGCLPHLYGTGEDPLPRMQAHAGRLLWNARRWGVVVEDAVPSWMNDLYADFLAGPFGDLAGTLAG